MTTVALLLFDGVEVLDFAGPYEVLAGARDDAGAPVFAVTTLAPRAVVRCEGGLRVVADATLADSSGRAFDLVVVPGGPGARERTPDGPAVEAWVAARKGAGAALASVCTGSFLLARAGLLDGRRATTHHWRAERFRREFPRVTLLDERLVDEGDVVTAAGVSSGIDLALFLVERYAGTEARRREADRIEWSSERVRAP